MLVIDFEALKVEVHQALKDWTNQADVSRNMLEHLLLVQNMRIKLNAKNVPALLRLATNNVLLAGIDRLQQENAQQAKILRLRFADRQKISMVAATLGEDEHYVNRNQAIGIERLTWILIDQEETARKEKAQELEALLPAATYSSLVGDEMFRQTLMQQLVRQEPPWIVALVGLGGWGKTAVADYVTRQIIHQLCFDGVYWQRVERQVVGRVTAETAQLSFENLIAYLFERLFPQVDEVVPHARRLYLVRQQLKKRPYLIVVDNLEDEFEVIFLLQRLHDLAQPSKFLVTTRVRPGEQTNTFNYVLEQLSLPEAVSLMQLQAQIINMKLLTEATEADFAAIYNLVGGNPLALKLAVSLLRDWSLPQVLTNLQRGQTGKIEEMYMHIYRQVWQSLSEPARTLLRAMPLIAGSGALPDYLMKGSQLSEQQLWPALRELCDRSLLEVRGTLYERRYGIHHLTDTFLRTDILGLDDVS